MEKEILDQLITIKGLLVWIVILLTIFIGSSILQKLANGYSSIKASYRNFIKEEAQTIYERGEYEKLLPKLKKRLVKTPNDCDLVYWLARLKFDAKEYEEAKLHFERVIELEPRWAEEHINPYIKKINENTNKAHQSE